MSNPIKKTQLNSLHKELGGKLVPFCGWEMPLNYPKGTIHEVEACRKQAALFDVSHMGQVVIEGKDRIEFIEKIACADVKAMKNEKIQYSYFLTPKGGVIDDTMICKQKDNLYVVVNAACYDKDMKHMKEIAKEFYDVKITNLYDTHSLIALQGPNSEKILSNLASGKDKETVKNMKFMQRKMIKIGGVLCGCARSGYTGEDGFEIMIPHKYVRQISEAILKEAEPAGLASRDTLRLEAALSLYGNDLDENTTPVQAGLMWAMTKRRKQIGGYIGADVIKQELKNQPKTKRVYFIMDNGIARHGNEIMSNGKKVGIVTSAGPSVILGKNIGFGTVPTEMAKIGNKLDINIRGRIKKATIVKGPFVPHGYKK